jgi:DNA mismatch repair protein MutS2
MIEKETLKSLEFDKVLNAISAFSHSDASGESIMGIMPIYESAGIQERFSLVRELRRLSQEGVPLGFERFEDITGVIERARPEGAVLDADELLALLPVLNIISSVSGLLDERDDLPALGKFAEGLDGFPELLAAVERTIDSEGNILDSASFELSDIRTRRRALDKKISKRLESVVRDREITPFLQDDFITKRSGRWVIPVRMDAKGEVQGVVHDVSRSGETAFVEPLEIIGLSNQLENLVAEEKAEEIRILRAVSAMVRGAAGELYAQFVKVVELDLLQGIALFSERHGLEEPGINDSSFIRLDEARHTLLVLMREGGGVVPLDLSLGGEEKVMAITGPNAGGKTIAIKTVGLLTLMALSGIPVPARSSSSFPLLDNLLVDIGDEQSIEESLSTFSAHVSNISRILGKAGPGTVVLMDELGTGTDPAQGAAIGSAVLRELMDKGAVVFATTHLIDVVGFVHRNDGMVNASMEFDQATLTPLYRLIRGEPGESHAIEIAKQYGLPESTMNYAKTLLGTMKAEFQELISELKQKRVEYERALDGLEAERRKIEEKQEALDEKLKAVRKEREEVLEGAYSEARDLIADFRRKAHEVLEETKRKKTRAPIRKLDRARKNIEQKLEEFRREPVIPIEEISVGERVFVRTIGYDAEVLKVDLKGKRVRVKAGDKELEVPASSIGPGKGKALKEKVKRAPERPDEEVQMSLNLLGLRVDEALRRIEPFLNHASLSGLGEVVVIHGIGTGALMKAVREHLDGHPLVEGFRAGEPSEGGHGVTVVRLK